MALPQSRTDLDEFRLRIELFQDQSDPKSFRAQVWRTEYYRIQSTFPQHPKTGRPTDQPSDELILVDWSANLMGGYQHFESESVETALRKVLDDLEALVARVSRSPE